MLGDSRFLEKFKTRCIVDLNKNFFHKIKDFVDG